MRFKSTRAFMRVKLWRAAQRLRLHYGFRMRLRAIAIASMGWLTCWGLRLGAEHLPIRTYTTAGGLPADQIQRILR